MMFYKETNFKDTEIGRIPKEWEVVELENVVEIWDKYRVPVKEQDRKPGPFPYCGANGIIDYVAGYTHDGEFVLLAEDGGFFGPFENSAYIMRGKFWANNHVHILKAIEGILINEFLMYCLNFMDLTPFLTGSTRPKLTQKDMREIPLPLPPIQEQQKIAEILSAVDEAIQKTNEIIAKTERLKKGLMQELLTKGIGHKEFKDTEIGRIPEKWQIVSIGDVCEQRSEIVLPSENSDEPFVGLEHITSGETRLHNYARSADVKSAKFRFYTGDILYGKLRPYLDKAVIAEFKGICSTDILVLKPKENMIGEFLIYILHSESFIKHAIATMRGTNHPRTSWSAISRYKFGLPDRFEQQKIAEILSTVDKKLEIEREEKVRLEKIKQGLMDLLLTGKIRVRVS